MNLSKTTGFLISAIASFFILNRLPIDTRLVEVMRLERTSAIDKDWSDDIANQCSKVASVNSTREEELWAERLQAKGFGETRPVADNRTAAGRDRNRRVELVILHRGP